MKQKVGYIIVTLMFVLIIIFSGIYIFNKLLISEKKISYDNLSSFALQKINQIHTWRKERIYDGRFIKNNSEITTNIFDYIHNPHNHDLKENIQQWFKSIKENPEYQDVIIITKNLIPHSLFDDNYELHQRDSLFLAQSLEEEKVVLGGLYKSSKSAEISLGTYIPLSLRGSKEVFAFVKLKISPFIVLYPLIETNSSSSNTAETFLIRKEGDSLIFLNNTRFRKDAALRLKLPLKNQNFAAALALKDTAGIFEGNDYRGVRVLAHLNKIPDSPWFIVSKIDQDEIQSPIKLYAQYITLTAVMLISVCLLIAYSFWRDQKLKILEEQILYEKERLTAAEALKKSEERFEIIFRNSPLAKVLMDAMEYRIIDVNIAFEQLYGYTREEVIGKTSQDLSLYENMKEREETISYISKRESVQNLELQVKRKDGEIRTVLFHLNHIVLEGKKCILSVIQDISKNKQAQLRTQALLNDLKRSNRDLEAFAYSASHDLHEPIRMIKSYAQLINFTEKNRLNDSTLEFLGFIEEGAERMQQLVNDLLTYSRLSTVRYESEEVDCNIIVKEVLTDLKFMIEEAQAEIHIDHLPTIKGIKTQIRQLFQNFIQNAIKFKSERIPAIFVSCEKRKDEWLFSIKDNGIGIEHQYFDKIFVLFQRLHTHEKYEGTGIGLAMCKKIIELHGGQICLDSEKDKGTTFYFTLPYNENSKYSFD